MPSKTLNGDYAGALSSSRKSKDRNYQVLNHLMFWLWFLRDGQDGITLTIDGAEVIVSGTFLNRFARKPLLHWNNDVLRLYSGVVLRFKYCLGRLIAIHIAAVRCQRISDIRV